MLKNKVALITGASRGIGKAIARKLVNEGMRVAITGSSKDIHKTKDELEGDIISIQADVGCEESMQEVMVAVTKKFGTIDLLVNNAGMGFFKKVEETEIEEWRQMFRVNVDGVFISSKLVLPYMKKQNSGSIITITSDVARYTIPNGSAYTATKYAAQGFSGSLAQEVKEYGIRVGTINPGMVDTYFNESEQGVPEKKAWMKAEDIAEAVRYMASAPAYMMIDELTLHPFIQDYPRI